MGLLKSDQRMELIKSYQGMGLVNSIQDIQSWHMGRYSIMTYILTLDRNTQTRHSIMYRCSI